MTSIEVRTCDVISGNVFGNLVLGQQKGWDRGREVGAPKRCKQHGCFWAWLWKALVGTGLAISLFLCMTWLRRQSSGLVGPPFWQWSFFSRSARAVIDYIVNSLMSGCACSESQICRGLMQGQLGEVLNVNT